MTPSPITSTPAEDGIDGKVANHMMNRRTIFLLGGVLALAVRDTDNTRARSRQSRRRRGSRRYATISPQLIACDASSPSGIAGLVTIGPMCPVATPDDPCPDRPYAAKLVVQDSAGREVCAAASGEDGRFRIGLAPGEYQLVPVNGVGGLPYASPQTVTVAPNAYTDVSVSFDSGIR